MNLRMVTAGVTVVTATVCAVMPIGSTYAPGPMPILLGAATVGAAVLTGLLRSAGRSAATTLLSSLAGLAAAIVALGFWLPRPPGSPITAIAEALANSGARFLTSAVPVPSTLETAALPICATWLAATVAVILLTSPRPASAGLAPLLLFVATLVFVGPASTPSYGYGAILVAALALLLGLLGTTNPSSGAPNLASSGTNGATFVAPGGARRWTSIGAAGLAVLLGGATVWVAPVLLGDGSVQPPDLRAHVVPPYQNPDQINPLSMLAGWAAQPDRALLEVTTNQPTRLRWVTLPDFTGITWLPAPQYRAAGAVLPVPATGTATARAATASAAQVHQDMNITGLTGAWLPVPDGAREVRGVRVAIDVDSDTLAAPDGLTNGVRYSVTAVPPVWQPDRLATARLPAAEAYDPYRTLPAGAPGRLSELAREAAGSATTPYQQAKELESYLRRAYGFDPHALGGNGYPSLDRFLFQPPELGGGRGTSEQFATAFAILARAMGIPARVVVGFDPGQRLTGNRYQIRGGDALAWPEVYLDGEGWVPFDPTPTESTREEPAPVPVAPVAAPTPTTAPDPNDGGNLGDDPAQPDASAPGPDLAATSASTGVTALLVVLAALALVVGWRQARGARRRRRGTPSQRVLGAWVELRDGLRLAGQRPGDALAVEEVAELAGSTAGDQWRVPAAAVAAAVNAAGFGGAALAAEDATAVDDLVRALRRALWRATSPGRRLIWPVDPRPLWWR